MTAPLQSLLAIAQRHAEAEGGQDVEAILSTMEGEPVYEFHPLGKRFTGMANTRRFYRHFIDAVQPRMIGSTLISEASGPYGVTQEYDVELTLIGESAPSRHRIMAILVFGERALSGERMYAGERLFRTLAGPLWDELEPIPADAAAGDGA
jgi:hypothetical protein